MLRKKRAVDSCLAETVVTGGANMKILGEFTKLRKAIASFIMSVCPSVRRYATTSPPPQIIILNKFDIQGFFENLSKKLKFHCNMTRITGA